MIAIVVGTAAHQSRKQSSYSMLVLGPLVPSEMVQARVYANNLRLGTAGFALALNLSLVNRSAYNSLTILLCSPINYCLNGLKRPSLISAHQDSHRI